MSVASALAAGEARPCCEPVLMPALKSFSQAFNGWSRSSFFKTTEASSAKNSPRRSTLKGGDMERSADGSVLEEVGGKRGCGDIGESSLEAGCPSACL
eukprot:2090483-Pyramimonas_sp.AAC.1